jgi:ketosteroid isomerase-like protein
MRIWTEDFDHWEFHTERVVDAGDKVVALAGQKAQGKASGARVETFMGMVFTFEDSKVKRLQIYVDPEDALEAAGLSE